MKRVILALAALAAVVGGLGVVPTFVRASRPADLLEALNHAQPQRVYAPRFSAGTEYHACTVDRAFADSLIPVETCAPLNDRQLEQLDRLDELAAARQSLDPDSLRASALFTVLSADVRSLDDAIDRLSRVRLIARNRVSTLVDLSAAHLVRAQRMQGGEDVYRALEYALEALELDPGNQRAAFNAAMAAQAGYLRQVADDLWGRYLELDSTSEFAQEAKQRRSALRVDSMFVEPDPSSPHEVIQAFVKRHPQQTREFGMDTVLGRWGRAVLQDSTARADTLLLFAERLGTALRNEEHSDASLIEAVHAIIAASDNRAATRTLARAHRAFAEGRDLIDRGEWTIAADSFSAVLRHRPVSHSVRDWARVELAAVLFLNKQVEESLRTLQPLVGRADTLRHPALSARVLWIRASLPRDSSSLLFGQAARTFERLRERERYAGVRYRQAWTAHGRGETSEAYRMLNETFRAFPPRLPSTQLHNALVQSAELMRRDGMSRVAQLIQDEDYRLASRSRNPTVQVEALQSRARIRALSGSLALARQDLETAQAQLKVLREPTQVQYLGSAQRFARTLVDVGEKKLSGTALDSAIDYFRKEKKPSWLMSMLVLRAEVRLESGNLDGADADLDSIISQLDPLRNEKDTFHLRAVVLERRRAIHDRLVMRYVRIGKFQKAFEVLERSRVSLAPDSSKTDSNTWVPPRPGQVVLEYALIGDTLLTWLVRRDSITLREQRLNRDSLLQTIARVDVAMESSAPDSIMLPGLRRLYDVLIRPVRHRIPAGAPEQETELVIVADGEIAGVHFNMLPDSTGKRLLEDHPISYAVRLADMDADSLPAERNKGVLMVANPDFDRNATPELGPLPGAEKEVKLLRRFYPGARVLADSVATVTAFRDSVDGVRIVHYAGHARFDNGRPERSFLLLAQDSGSTGRLTADSVNQLPLKGVELVVLSTCETVRGAQGRSGGFAGLSGALLNAGAHGVVGSLWLVNDRLAQPLMVAFHREHTQERLSPARALRRAQLEMMGAGHPPSAWAGFRYMGR